MNSARQDARELLAFYLDAGVDALLGEVAVDRFADNAPTSPSPESGRSESRAFPVAVGGEAPSNNDPAAGSQCDDPALPLPGRKGFSRRLRRPRPKPP